MKFGEKLKVLREQKKLTQPELEKATGISLRSIQYYESGKGYPRRELYPKLAEFFGVEINFLLTENEEFLDEAAIKYGRRGQIQAAQILDQVAGLLAGGDMSDEDQAAFSIDIQRLFFKASDIASEKFDPTKNRK